MEDDFNTPEITKDRIDTILKNTTITSKYWSTKTHDYRLWYLTELLNEEFDNSSDCYCATDEQILKVIKQYFC